MPEERAEQARAKERKKASKQQRVLKEETLSLCGWLLLYSSLPSAHWSDSQVLALSRARWQVELAIKRMKQLLGLAQLRGRTTCTNEASLLALLVAWALLQPEVASARSVLSQASAQWVLAHSHATVPEPSAPLSPPPVSSWTLTALCLQTLRQLVQLTPTAPFSSFFLCSSA